jgi:hypothetical protein
MRTTKVYLPVGRRILGAPLRPQLNAGDAQPASRPQTMPVVKKERPSAQKVGYAGSTGPESSIRCRSHAFGQNVNERCLIGVFAESITVTSRNADRPFQSSSTSAGRARMTSPVSESV